VITSAKLQKPLVMVNVQVCDMAQLATSVQHGDQHTTDHKLAKSRAFDKVPLGS